MDVKMTNQEMANQYKALGDETRLRIIAMLGNGELCACNILAEFSITQPTLSYHMKILTETGLVKVRKDGAWMRYTLNRPAIESLGNRLALIAHLEDKRSASVNDTKERACV